MTVSTGNVQKKLKDVQNHPIHPISNDENPPTIITISKNLLRKTITTKRKTTIKMTKRKRNRKKKKKHLNRINADVSKESALQIIAHAINNAVIVQKNVIVSVKTILLIYQKKTLHKNRNLLTSRVLDCNH